MAKTSSDESLVLLRWSKHVPSSDVQDPLGTSLRGATRLASRLLHCITSITPRARYFSFIPWAIGDFLAKEKGKPYAVGISKAVAFREHALTLGCIAHHDGSACKGGRLVGSRKAIKWYATRRGEEADFRRISFVDIPALNAYFNSLVNLGMFVTDDELPDTDEEEVEQRTFEDIELSPLGREVADAYGQAVKGLAVLAEIASPERRCSIESARRLGEHGGLCELTDPASPDRLLLREIMFRCRDLKGESHPVRRRSLLLMLHLCRELANLGLGLDHATFADAVYFGDVGIVEQRKKIEIPIPLTDILLRWRMWYFHYYLAVALEGLFACVTSISGEAGLAGVTMNALVARLDEPIVASDLKRLLGTSVPSAFTETPVSRFFSSLGLNDGSLDEGLSHDLDNMLRANSLLSEPQLELLIRGGDYLYSPTGIALPLMLLVVVLARYKQWERSNYGQWLASVAADPYLDLVPPVVLDGITRRLGDWWNRPLGDLAEVVVSRYVVQQHQSMSYEKTAAGERCILQVDGDRICATGTYEKIGVGNARLGSAMLILSDLALIRTTDSGDTNGLTGEGEAFLDQELAKEVEA